MSKNLFIEIGLKVSSHIANVGLQVTCVNHPLMRKIKKIKNKKEYSNQTC